MYRNLINMEEVVENVVERVLTIEEVTEKFVSMRMVLFRHLMWHMNLNRDDAEDLLQEVYFKIYKNAHKFKADTNFSAWCFVITKRLFIDKYRMSRNNQYVDVDGDELELMLGKENNGSEDNFLKEDILNAINSITTDIDKKLAFLYYEGYSYTDMADEMKLPLGTVKNKLYRIKAHLAKRLEFYK